MLLAKSRPIVVICIADGSHFARERLMAFTPWHLDAVSGSHPPHLFIGKDRMWVRHRQTDAIDPGCVKTLTSQDCAELFSLFSVSDGDWQHCWFQISENRDRIPRHKSDVGVFTQPGPTTDIGDMRSAS